MNKRATVLGAIGMQREMFEIHPNVVRAVGSTAAILLGFLVREADSYEDERTHTAEEILAGSGLDGLEAMRAARARLVSAGLVTERRGGMPSRLFFKVNGEAILALLVGQ